jgi:ubiquinone/menaquinone biosynthesis C-methylase UbiE
VRTWFASEVLRQLQGRNLIAHDHEVLAVCAGESDRRLLSGLGFSHVTLTNVDVQTGTSAHDGAGAAGAWEVADVQALPYPDRSFDFAFVSDGLHHCRSPHRAITEMCRVARLGIIVVESRDSLAVRAARRIGITGDYEFNDRLLTTRTHGGADFGPVPNFVYRWTEREFEKCIATYEPEFDHHFFYFYGFNPPDRIRRRLPFLDAAGSLLTSVTPRQGNTFALVAVRGPVKRYLSSESGGYRLCSGVTSESVQRRYPPPRRQRFRIR